MKLDMRIVKSVNKKTDDKITTFIEQFTPLAAGSDFLGTWILDFSDVAAAVTSLLEKDWVTDEDKESIIFDKFPVYGTVDVNYFVIVTSSFKYKVNLIKTFNSKLVVVRTYDLVTDEHVETYIGLAGYRPEFYSIMSNMGITMRSVVKVHISDEIEIPVT